MKISSTPFGMIAALAILLMAVAAGFAYGYVQSSLLSQNAQSTLQNIQASPGLLQACIISWIIVLLCDLVVCWALYHYFREVHVKISLLSSGLRLLYSLWLAVAIAQLLSLLPIHENPDLVLAEHVMQQFEAFETIWSAGLIIFGIHLLALAYLTLLSRHIPRIFGWLLILAGLSYVLVHTGKWLFPGLLLVDQLETLLSLPMAVGELAFALWLLFCSRWVALSVHPSVNDHTGKELHI